MQINAENPYIRWTMNIRWTFNHTLYTQIHIIQTRKYMLCAQMYDGHINIVEHTNIRQIGKYTLSTQVHDEHVNIHWTRQYTLKIPDDNSFGRLSYTKVASFKQTICYTWGSLYCHLTSRNTPVIYLRDNSFSLLLLLCSLCRFQEWLGQWPDDITTPRAHR